VKKEMDHVLFDCSTIDVTAIFKDSSKRKVINKKVFATGNFDLDDMEQIADCGFGGIILQNAIWDRFDIHNTQDFKEIINHFRKIKRIVD
jgi:thiamine-phosphate pyrophosphorylase